MLVAFSWNAPSSVTTKSTSSSKAAKGRSAEPSYAEKLFVPMMIAKKPRLEYPSPNRPAMTTNVPQPVVVVPVPEAAAIPPSNEAPKPAPLCWCPLSAPAKTCWRPKDDRLHPGRAFYQCANIPSCSFFAWCESNEEFAAKRAAQATQPPPPQQQQQQQMPAAVVPVPSAVRSENTPTSLNHATSTGVITKPKSITIAETKPKSISTTTATRGMPYVSSEPISIPTRRLQCAFFDSFDMEDQCGTTTASPSLSRRAMVY